MAETVRIMVPEGRVVPARHTLAPRLGSFQGKRIAVLDNTKPNADVILTTAAKALVRDHGAAGYQVFDKPNPAVPFLERDREALATCDLLLTGTGD
jgi:hypothetical protein